ncbi:unnamed protein product [Rotaria sp. Silwood2]|nr:unnamed protein product [Rotaria sp. Silwood2]CAF3066996.1 unnamed protein product [Rotaria sp. Silwood2]CAF3140976.1 unnamed protein product [Rotaria sp. Silwood2]CAF3220278.1 unnamed protein product [Rotaria sp. Silwood2]CAF4020969.1 unnamed protein product [Rotaria sp. Silwood2]
MTLSAAQMSLCFQSYWYMWLTNGLSGLLFMGIDIGIAAFFMAKFSKKKPSKYQRPPSVNNRPISPNEINTFENSERNTTSRRSNIRSSSAKLDNSGSTEDSDDFAHATCEIINLFRQQYDAPPVELDDTLSDIAQDWANQMAETGKLEHRPLEYRNFGRQSLGENYAAQFQIELTANKMVRKWMKEGRKYRFGTDGRRDTNNFTQLVWQGSRQIGVGRTRSADGNWWYGVVVFDPPGNIPNQYADNVNFPSS